jgi:Arc/MetJ-type ribon-helix-helix transcriptional regulator
MTIHLPEDLENSVRAEVQSGHFATADDAVAEIVRDYFRRRPAKSTANPSAPAHDPIMGCMRDDAKLMDEIVADAYRQRREETWRKLDL